MTIPLHRYLQQYLIIIHVVLVALKKSQKWQSWLPAIWELGKGIHCRHFFKEQISVLLREQDITG